MLFARLGYNNIGNENKVGIVKQYSFLVAISSQLIHIWGLDGLCF